MHFSDTKNRPPEKDQVQENSNKLKIVAEAVSSKLRNGISIYTILKFKTTILTSRRPLEDCSGGPGTCKNTVYEGASNSTLLIQWCPINMRVFHQNESCLAYPHPDFMLTLFIHGPKVKK